jgi:thiamine-monophosphate kinase
MNEQRLVERLKGMFPPGRDIEVGIGDDCAVWNSSSVDLITTDTLVETVHYRLDWGDAGDVGWKTLMVSLSDIAAMGGTPRFILLNLVAPRSKTEAFLDDYIGGIREAIGAVETLPESLSLIGGDTAVSPSDTMSTSTVMGASPTRGAIQRSGAEPGDKIFVTGPLGDSRGGLEVLQSETPPANWSGLVNAYLRPMARVDLGRRLGVKPEVTSLIDTSDGLGIDLHRIVAASGVGARVNVDDIPCSEQLLSFCKSEKDREALEYAVGGGEDFELLGTINCELDELSAGLSTKLHVIGEVTEDAGNINWLEDNGDSVDFDNAGYDHFYSDFP